MNQDFEKIEKILTEIPLRICITDYCNLNCFFCSNEGLGSDMRNTASANFDNLLFLLNFLKRKGLKKIALTGGDPTCYPKINDLLGEINKLEFDQSFFHTNGVALTKKLILGELKKFSKIAISIHSIDFEEWKKMTKGHKKQFDKILENLKLISEENYGDKIEIKIVSVKGINDSKESIKKTLDFCNKNNFKFKFLIFEPMEESHHKLVVSLEKMDTLLREVGATQLSKEKSFRGQSDYLPINKYQYKSTQGVLIEIGCGKKEVCRACSDSNELFVTPELAIKPCHISPFTLELKEAISDEDEDKILSTILRSRGFLKISPGENKQYWRRN
jgi:GTP 3',8-cyclase